MAMAGRIHKKYGSDESMGTLSSSQRSPLYYVESPQSLDVEKLSIRSNSVDLTPNHSYHHSRGESSTSRYSTSWKKLDEKNYKNDEDDEVVHYSIRKYICCFFGFVLIFAVVCFILWAVGRSFKPRVNLESIEFKNFDVQFGNDRTGVPTYLLSLNSTIKMMYTNPATYFGVYVTSTHLQLRYYDLTLASGQMQEFHQSSKSQQKLVVFVYAKQVPLYGGISILGNDTIENMNNVAMAMNITFEVKSKADILGVWSTFYQTIGCPITFHVNQLGKPLSLIDSCVYK